MKRSSENTVGLRILDLRRKHRMSQGKFAKCIFSSPSAVSQWEMTKKELEQYRSVVAEIRETEERIKENTVTDTVSGSDAEFPYTKHAMSVAGLEKTEYNNMLLARRNKLQRQRRKVERYKLFVLVRRRSSRIYQLVRYTLEFIKERLIRLASERTQHRRLVERCCRKIFRINVAVADAFIIR